MASVVQTLSKTAIDSELSLSTLALTELCEAYEVFCAYGTHPTSWRSLAVQLHLYLETIPGLDSSDGLEKRTFTQVLSQLDTEHFAYLISDTLLALFRLNPISQRNHGWSLYEVLEGTDAHTFATLFSEVENLPLYLSRRYLHKIARNELHTLLSDIRQEIQTRTRSTYFTICCDQLWSPSSGSYPSILLHCGIQLPSDDANALLAYAIGNGTYSVDERITEKPKSRNELRSALLKLPKRLIRAATLGPEGLVLRQQTPEHIPETGWSAVEANVGTMHDAPRASLPLKGFTIGSRKGRTTTKTVRARALSLDSFTKKDFIPSTKGALEALWRRRRVVSWPSNLSPREDVDMNQSTRTQEPTDMSLSRGLDFDIPRPLEPLFEDTKFTLKTEQEVSHGDFGSQTGTLSCPDSYPLSKSVPKSYSMANEASILYDEGVDVSFDDLLDPMGSGHSCSSTHQSFVTADTHHPSLRRYQIHEESNRDSAMSCDTFGSLNDGSPELSDYLQLLQRRDLIPEPVIETNWSGRGQHAEFHHEERDLIPLEAEKLLGRTQTALVESVRCKRVRLVRKVIRCNRRTGIKREEAVSEVQHLYRAQHSHIVRLVGTYVVEDDLAILTYPCAEWDLQRFMSTATKASDLSDRASALRRFFTCLANVLDFIHSCPIKHMDLKPQNILVRDIRHSTINDSDLFKVYVTDFGISRSYSSIEACDTETPTSFTRTYAAMEVVLQESRGLAADIFSLGCVYAEMLATLLDMSSVQDTSAGKITPTFWGSLRIARTDPENGLRPYHSTLSNVRSWLLDLPILESELAAIRGWILQMLNYEAAKRPTARQIADDPRLLFSCLSCSLRSGPEDFEVARPIKNLSEHPP